MSKLFTRFDLISLSLVELDQHTEAAKSMLTPELAKVRDGWGTLLHYAAASDKVESVKRLIELGADVNSLSVDGKTPLMLVVQTIEAAAVDALLEANADFRSTDSKGKSVLQVVLHPEYDNDEIALKFLLKLYHETATMDEMVEQLTAAGCSFYTAALLQNVDLLDALLKRGYDINNSRGTLDRTALHLAVDKKNLKLAKWLIDRDANVEVFDSRGRSVLLDAAMSTNTDMVKFLLEMGANPNIKSRYTNTPLFELCTVAWKDEGNECVQLLLQHGAILKYDDAEILTIFDWVLLHQDHNKSKLLVAHLALLDKLGKSVTNSVMYCKLTSLRMAFTEIVKYYEECQQILDVIVFDTLTLFDLLTITEYNMNICLRNETFISTIEAESSNHELKDKFPYFFNILFKKLSVAVDGARR